MSSFTYFASQTNFNNNQNISQCPYRSPAEFYTYLLPLKNPSVLGPELRSDVPK